ncbi:MAG: rane protein [Marmoricola sp.]|nr:rane protein [Marmoricola sp.]
MARHSSGADVAPPTNRTLVVIAAVLLAIPVVALLWVSSYAHDTPELGGVPFFFWYQFLWVFLCAGCTYAAHRLVLAARKPGAGTTGNPGRIAPRDGAAGGATREEGDR